MKCGKKTSPAEIRSILPISFFRPVILHNEQPPLSRLILVDKEDDFLAFGGAIFTFVPKAFFFHGVADGTSSIWPLSIQRDAELLEQGKTLEQTLRDVLAIAITVRTSIEHREREEGWAALGCGTTSRDTTLEVLNTVSLSETQVGLTIEPFSPM
jgi:hypothetical protein